jgi:hypothetical protein
MALILLFLACADSGDTAAPAAALVPLEGPALARRVSLDLRGVLPGVDELDQVEADSAALDVLVEDWLHDPRFEDRLVSLFTERFLTRLDRFESRYYDYLLEPTDDQAFVRSIGEEPLRLMAHVASTDAPWTDIVTVDYTMADEMLDAVWDLDYPADTSGWQQAWYEDGRPAAGILATNGLWWRYVTNTSNLSRSRAAAISSLLLCNDYLARQVSLSAATGSDSTEDAIRTQPACVGCHVSIDPLAASLFGFYTLIGYNPDEMQNYHPDRENLGEDLLGVSPSYFGTPIGGLADLGVAIAQDPRFVRCAAQNMAQALWRRPVEDADFATVESYRQDFIAGGLTMRALVRSILASDTYRAGGLGEGAEADDEARERTVRMLSADQLATVTEDLTGFRWTYTAYDLLGNDTVGFRVLAGGVDGETVASPQGEPGLTWALVVKRLAEGGASYAVDRELVGGAEDRRLFGEVTLDDRPGDAAFDAELTRLHRRLYGERPSADRLAAAAALWSAIEADSGPAEAWKGLVSGLLRDPELVAY